MDKSFTLCDRTREMIVFLLILCVFSVNQNELTDLVKRRMV